MRPLLPAAAFLALIFLAAGPFRVLAAAPVWDYVYFPDTLPENAPAGAWETDHDPGQEPTVVGGRLSFNLSNNAKFYYRDDTLDPNFPTPTLTFEWKSETLNAGYFDIGVYGGWADATDLIFDGFYSRSDQQVLNYFAFYNQGHVDVPLALAKGARTYRIVKRLNSAELYVDGELQATRPASGIPIYEVYLQVASFYDIPPYYTAIWDHVAYTRGAFTPEELPSPVRVGNDMTAPAAVADLRSTDAATSSITLAWTAPGDDANTGTATSYDLRFTTTGPITADAQFEAALQAVGEPAPQAAGSAETFTLVGLAPGTTYYFALKTADEANNASALSNSPVGATARAVAGRLSKVSPLGDHIGVVGSTVSLTVAVKDAGGAALADVGVDFSVTSFPVGAIGQGFASSDTVTGADGKAAAIFRLGIVPADYAVRCTCPTCETDVGMMTFKACGKLKNDDFKQFDSRWAAEYYDNLCRNTTTGKTVRCTNGQPAPSGTTKLTIHKKGCALSAVATLVNYYRDTFGLSISSFTPKTLNTHMISNGLYRGLGNVDWEVAKNASAQQIEFLERLDVENGDEPSQFLPIADADILAGRPAVFRVLSDSFTDHFIVAVGKCGSKYLVANPGASAVMWDPADEPIFGIRRFRRP